MRYATDAKVSCGKWSTKLLEENIAVCIYYIVQCGHKMKFGANVICCCIAHCVEGSTAQGFHKSKSTDSLHAQKCMGERDIRGRRYRSSCECSVGFVSYVQVV